MRIFNVWTLIGEEFSDEFKEFFMVIMSTHEDAHDGNSDSGKVTLVVTEGLRGTMIKFPFQGENINGFQGLIEDKKAIFFWTTENVIAVGISNKHVWVKVNQPNMRNVSAVVAIFVDQMKQVNQKLSEDFI